MLVSIRPKTEDLPNFSALFRNNLTPIDWITNTYANPIGLERVGTLQRKELIEWKEPIPINLTRKSDYYLL